MNEASSDEDENSKGVFSNPACDTVDWEIENLVKELSESVLGASHNMRNISSLLLKFQDNQEIQDSDVQKVEENSEFCIGHGLSKKNQQKSVLSSRSIDAFVNPVSTSTPRKTTNGKLSRINTMTGDCNVELEKNKEDTFEPSRHEEMITAPHPQTDRRSGNIRCPDFAIHLGPYLQYVGEKFTTLSVQNSMSKSPSNIQFQKLKKMLAEKEKAVLEAEKKLSNIKKKAQIIIKRWKEKHNQVVLEAEISRDHFLKKEQHARWLEDKCAKLENDISLYHKEMYKLKNERDLLLELKDQLDFSNMQQATVGEKLSELKEKLGQEKANHNEELKQLLKEVHTLKVQKDEANRIVTHLESELSKLKEFQLHSEQEYKELLNFVTYHIDLMVGMFTLKSAETFEALSLCPQVKEPKYQVMEIKSKMMWIVEEARVLNLEELRRKKRKDQQTSDK